jgi:hypothetical protein
MCIGLILFMHWKSLIECKIWSVAPMSKMKVLCESKEVWMAQKIPVLGEGCVIT